MSDDKDEDEKKNNKITYKQSKFVFQSSYNERKWLKAHGKEDYIDFKDEEILVLRKYFKSLDSDGSGSIGVEELEDPLIALGLAQNRDEVLKLIKQVDEDGSGDIEFKEFLSIMSSVQKTDKNKGGGDESEKGAIFDFFKKMSTGQFDNQMDKIVPFRLNVSMYRRRKILDAIMSSNKEKKDKGQKILQSFKKQLIFYKRQEKIEKGEDPNDISIDQIPNNESGVNTRNGFPKMPRIIQQSNKLLVKPKANPIQNQFKQ
ncbi:hypothetical protein ABPG72_000427 [Tetrahymena utriculariae]